MRRAVLKVSATDGKESNMVVLQYKSMRIDAARKRDACVISGIWGRDGSLRLPNKPRVDKRGEFLGTDSKNRLPVQLHQHTEKTSSKQR